MSVDRSGADDGRGSRADRSGHRQPMRVLVCGSRDWLQPAVISKRLKQLPAGSCIVHGAARGADVMAASIAIGMGFSVDVFPANWRHHGRAAGYIRNLAMLDTKPDLVLAFQRNGSRGTQHTIDEARRRGIPVEVFTA